MVEIAEQICWSGDGNLVTFRYRTGGNEFTIILQLISHERNGEIRGCKAGEHLYKMKYFC